MFNFIVMNDSLNSHWDHYKRCDLIPFTDSNANADDLTLI